MTYQQLFNLLLSDIRVELTDEFDRNFERKAFFNTQWPVTKHNPGIGSLMSRTGALRTSIESKVINNGITNGVQWSSSLIYADIHNTGGIITVTQKMRGFFWYRFRMATGGDPKNLNPDALFWRAMALKPVGSHIVIPQRQFIGDHPQVSRTVKQVTDDWWNNDAKQYINKILLTPD